MKTKLSFPGLNKILLPLRPGTGSPDTTAIRARALFHLQKNPSAARRRSLQEFLGQVSLFEDLGRGDLARLARIVHEREYGDGEYICEEGKPGAALFVVQRGVVEVVSGAGDHEVPLVLLEPPASFEESAACGTEVIRWFSVRARGPVSMLALGKPDLDVLIVNSPVLANKILIKIAGVMAVRLQMLIRTETASGAQDKQEKKP